MLARALSTEDATIPGIEHMVAIHDRDTGDECRARIAAILEAIGVVEADVSNVAADREEAGELLKAAARRAVGRHECPLNSLRDES